MKRDLRQPANGERGKSVLVLQPAELTLDGSATPVQVTPPLRLTRDGPVKSGSLVGARGKTGRLDDFGAR